MTLFFWKFFGRKMIRYKENKIQEKVRGYVRNIRGGFCIPNDVILLIVTFYDDNMVFEVYHQKYREMLFGKCLFAILNDGYYFGMNINGDLMVQGDNGFGQLGLNDRNGNINEVSIHNYFKGKDVVLSVSKNYGQRCFIVTKNNELYGF